MKKVHVEEEWDDYGPSKSQLKRDAEALQKLGEQLVDLRPSELAKVPLDEELADAIQLALKLKVKKNSAYSRHLQFIGRLMRSREIEPIEDALSAINHRQANANARLHRLEQWRERLITSGDEAINALLSEFHELDRQKLRQLVKDAQKEREQQKPPVAYRELFKYIKAEIEDRL